MTEVTEEQRQAELDHLAALLASVAMKVSRSSGPERVYLLYLLQKLVEGDLHGISDAANDMRVRGL